MLGAWAGPGNALGGALAAMAALAAAPGLTAADALVVPLALAGGQAAVGVTLGAGCGGVLQPASHNSRIVAVNAAWREEIRSVFMGSIASQGGSLSKGVLGIQA